MFYLHKIIAMVENLQEKEIDESSHQTGSKIAQIKEKIAARFVREIWSISADETKDLRRPKSGKWI